MKNNIQTIDWNIYFKQVRDSYLKGTEHTPRTPFENLINSIKPNTKIIITHEPKRREGFGAPDFKIEIDGAILGYIETKTIDEDLDKVLKSKQLKKYLSITQNLILTNYSEFILIKEQKVIDRVHLFHQTDLENKSAKLKEENIEATVKLFEKFFLSEPLKIGDTKELAVHLAERGKIVKEFIIDILKESSDDSFSQKIIGLYKAFKDTLVEDLTEEEFADAYAQTVIYGFFLAFLQSNKRISIDDASRLVPNSFKVIKEFFNVINDYSIPFHVKWIFQEVVNLINNIDLAGIYESISFKKRHAIKDKDPYLYFYETFLGAFDPKKKKAKGVYYTPIQVVSFISRAVNSLLEKDFSKEKGFADPSVTVLDFATGTGTFLVAIFELIFDKVGNDKGRFRKLVKEHLLKNFFGFEYLVAPYAVAHLKLSQLLKDNGYTLEDEDRLQVYLTDTLDNTEHKAIGMMPYLTQEGKDATHIKTQQKILVITGNPPYNSRSRNNKDWIVGQIKQYKPIDEKNIQPLNDDYIKFIRYAHWKINQTGSGIIAIITNNSFLNGLIHRKMRGELLRDFSKIYILNLHGHSRYGERTPDGTKDENVFDIQQGVSINIFVKKETTTEQCKVLYCDKYGSRDDKYNFLLEATFDTIRWENIDYSKFSTEFKNTRWSKRFQDSLNSFIPKKDIKNLQNYGDYFGLTEIFKKNQITSGVKSGSNEKYVKFKNTFDKEEETYVKPFLFKPFDRRYILYDPKRIQRARYEKLKHMVTQPNIALVFPRFALENEFTYGLVTDYLVDVKVGGKNSGSETFIAPLYLFNESREEHEGKLDFEGGIDRVVNYSTEFLNFVKQKYSFKPTHKQLFSYIYSILYAPSYRKEFEEFFKIDFPRIPFTDKEIEFNQLAKLGSELIEHHLMKCTYPSSQVSYPIEGNDIIDQIKFNPAKKGTIGKVNINKQQYFDNVSTNVWEFKIGGYPILETWLKYRKSTNLSYEGQETFIKICNILEFTIKQMKKIDSVYNTM